MKHAPRLPYCGTCKTLGAQYGQRSRLLLNHDTAFLAEILLELSGSRLDQPVYKSFNCLALPRRRQDIPIALDYAAAVTIVLAYCRLTDHLRDTPGLKFRWKFAARAIEKQYRAAAERLRTWRFPLDELNAILATQPAREANPSSPADAAEPTMIATSLVFAHGVKLAGRPDLQNHARSLGRDFGALTYFLDAFEDRERDARTGAFNPLRVFPYFDARQEILAITARLETEMPAAHAARLRINIEERLGLRPRVLHAGCQETLRLRDRVQHAAALARQIRDREHAGLFKGAAVLATVFAVAFFFPAHARQAESWHQCLGVSMNVMALSTFLAAAPPPPPQMPHQYPMAQPDVRGPSGPNCRGGLKDCCADTCLEAICEGIGDSICG